MYGAEVNGARQPYTHVYPCFSEQHPPIVKAVAAGLRKHLAPQAKTTA
jgi:hypothetical protein